ncbi:Hsp20/alpha crystallin family protein [Halobacteriales archaeon Cl-PHB]
MNLQQQFRDEQVGVREFAYDDRVVWAIDFGSGVDATVDVVDGTAIVVTDEDQWDLDLVDGADVFMNNGVLTIEVEG